MRKKPLKVCIIFLNQMAAILFRELAKEVAQDGSFYFVYGPS